jgi:hypothetical protein
MNMATAFRFLSVAILTAGWAVLASGPAHALQGMPAPTPMPAPLPAPAPMPAPGPRPLPGGGGGGGGAVGVPGGQALPELKWYELEPGLAKGKEENKPVVVVFATKAFKGPGTFESNLLRESLAKSAAIPVRVLPPEAPAVPAMATAEERKALDDKYQEALRAYRGIAGKYGASANPTVIFLSPDADVVGTLASPDVNQVNQWLTGLSKAIKDLEQKKAKAAAGK